MAPKIVCSYNSAIITTQRKKEEIMGNIDTNKGQNQEKNPQNPGHNPNVKNPKNPPEDTDTKRTNPLTNEEEEEISEKEGLYGERKERDDIERPEKH
jgi:hypothetical protein